MSFSVISARENLPRFVARRIAREGGKDFSRFVVVLPTARLGQHFLKELSGIAVSCLPPRVMTLPSLIAAARGLPPLRPVSPLERLLLIRSCLAAGSYRRLKPGMESAAADFFEELAGAGRPPDEKATYDLLRSAFIENPFGSADFGDYWAVFADELEKLAGEYRLKLGALGREESSWETVRRMEGALHLAFDRVFVCGFSDATPVQMSFLRRIADRAEFIYQAEASVAFSPVREFASRLGQVLDPELPRDVPPILSAVDAAVIRPLPDRERKKFVLYALPSLAAEARQAKFEALASLSRGETVMVVVPRSPEYVGVFSAVFSTPPRPEGAPIRLSSALARLCSDDPAVGLLKALLQLAVSRFGSYALSQYLLTPGGAAFLLPDPRAAAAAVRLLKRFLAEEFREGFASVRSALREWLEAGGEEGEAALDFLDRLRDCLAPFLDVDALSWKTWAAATLALFSRCRRLFPPGPLESAIRSRVTSSLEAMELVAPSFRSPLPPGEFFSLLKRLIFSDAVYLAPEPFRGVQLVHLLEARSIPADTVILCGMNEGIFPSALPARLVEEPFVREAMGVMTSDRREALEELNFFSLVLSASRVVLTRATQTLEEEAAESRFLTRLRLAGCLLTPPVPVGGEGDRLLHLLPLKRTSPALEEISAAVERARPTGLLPGVLPGAVSLNSGRCQTLLKCPFRFYLSLAGVEEEPEAREEPDPRYQGSVLHRVASGLWDRVLSEGGEWGKERLTEALSEIGERELPPVPALSALRLGMRCGGWRNFAG
ncbi:MAG: PD-(D/E)XK nuclease family protein, partial [Candidatus Aureabacteria bacterium]|nr:PD-(D/E)XK nuclease family protein [Candidatus Auribacterota bacterium]